MTASCCPFVIHKPWHFILFFSILDTIKAKGNLVSPATTCKSFLQQMILYCTLVWIHVSLRMDHNSWTNRKRDRERRDRKRKSQQRETFNCFSCAVAIYISLMVTIHNGVTIIFPLTACAQCVHYIAKLPSYKMPTRSRRRSRWRLRSRENLPKLLSAF